MSHKPYILFAFANEELNPNKYLRNLPKEQEALDKLFNEPDSQELCEHKILKNATVGQIIEHFQERENTASPVQILHFSGHGSKDSLVFQTLERRNLQAPNEPLADFFGKYKNLRLVFLNACYTKGLAEHLLGYDIPAIIGTSQAVLDEVATKFSLRFYKGMLRGYSLRRAFEEAKNQVEIEYAEGINGVFRDSKEIGWDSSSSVPWELKIKQGHETIQNYNFPDAAQKPLFNLHLPDSIEYPDEPYKYLKWYTRQDARVFFGRSHDIRKIYDRILNEKAAPILRIYGSSGVGKSSLLEAGLIPYLEQKAHVYVGRRKESGLVETLEGLLKKAANNEQNTLGLTNRRKISDLNEKILNIQRVIFGIPEGDPLRESLQIEYQRLDVEKKALLQSGELSQVSYSSNLGVTWRSIEQNIGGPLVLILDQVEEVFTKNPQGKAQEFSDFLTKLKEIVRYGLTGGPILGKIILAYRKEHSPEIEKGFQEKRLPHEGIFLDQIDREGIEEIAKGICSREELVRKYEVQEVEEALVETLSVDLDPGKKNTVAPILQIILTKLWRAAKDQNPRIFTLQAYKELKNKGVELEDFLTQQIATIETEFPQEVKSGLVLDILNFHVTDLGTAKEQSVASVKERYGHQEAKIDPILYALKSHRLLLPGTGESNRLAHDTLGPILQRRYKETELPGQRASRILDNKLPEYQASLDNKEGEANLLDKWDLKIVKDGQMGMRDWDEKESELIYNSQIQWDGEERRRKRTRQGLITLMVISLIAAIGAMISNEIAQSARKLANERGDSLELVLDDLYVTTSSLQESNAQLKEAKDSLVQSKDSLERVNENLNSTVMDLGLSRDSTRKALFEAENNLFIAQLARDSARNALLNEAIAKEKARRNYIEAQKEYIKAFSQVLAIKAQQIKDNDTLQAQLAINAYNLYNCGNKDKNSSYNTAVYNGLYQSLRNELFLGKELNRYQGITGAVNRIVFDPINSSKFYIIGNDGIIRTGNIQFSLSTDPGSLLEINNQDNKRNVPALCIDISPDGKWLAVGYKETSYVNKKRRVPQSSLSFVRLGAQEYKEFSIPSTTSVWDVKFLAKNRVLVSYGDTLSLWEYSSEKGLLLSKETIGSPIKDLSLNGTKSLLGGVNSQTGNIDIWQIEATSLELIHSIFPESGKFYSVAFRPHKQYNWMALGRDDGKVIIKSFSRPNLVPQVSSIINAVEIPLGGSNTRMRAVEFSPNGQFLATAGNDGTIRLYHIPGDTITNILQELPIILKDLETRINWGMDISFSKDGSQLLAGYKDRQLKIWPTNPRRLAEILKKESQNKLKDKFVLIKKTDFDLYLSQVSSSIDLSPFQSVALSQHYNWEKALACENILNPN